MVAEKIRIGIDVGGTFTHAVALDAATLELIGKTKVPTTHRAREGVAKGIVEALQALLKEENIPPGNVAFIAHSTTQATNALLEGDVAAVGIIGMGAGSINAWLSATATNLGKIELAPGKFLQTHHEFINTRGGVSQEAVNAAADALLKRGVGAIAVSEAFSVDDATNELTALEIIRKRGILATAGSEVSGLYGLKVRTRTAVINASMLPKMLESADMTEKSVREAGIQAPVMIMRSDGGVMDIDAMRKRPILTMLSGPAAGVAAAMMFLHISDGIFLEVGGTSTDISAISNGRAQVRSGEIGGHKVYMRTLDVRTVGVAGGSMARLDEGGHKIKDVGPRSAHIAGLKYASFQDKLADPVVKVIQPFPGDPADYVALSQGAAQEPTISVTPTCASNHLGLVPQGDCARGKQESIAAAFAALASRLNTSQEEAAKQILVHAAEKCEPVVNALIKDHKLDASLVTQVGGGGGAAAIVPFLAKKMDMPFELAEHADVISAIGVALSLIRETVERQVINPTNDDILRIRQEAHAAVQRMGADPASIEIHVEVDSRSNTVRATASGATSMTESVKTKRQLGNEERIKVAAESMRVNPEQVQSLASNGHFEALGATIKRNRLFGLLNFEQKALRLLDATGTIRLQASNGEAVVSAAATADQALAQLAEKHAQWGDAGKILPDMMLLAGPRIVDLSGLLDLDQILTVARTELETLPRDAQAIVIAKFH